MIISFKIFEGSVKKSDRIDIFRDDEYVVVAPLTAKASMKYGANTHWCTSVPDGSYMDAWSGDNIPNKGNRGLIILIRKNYILTLENKEKSDRFYYLSKKIDNAEITEEEQEEWNELSRDDLNLNLSKLCVVFSTNKNDTQVWSANNICLDWIYSLYHLENYDIDQYVIEEIENYINEVKEKKSH